MDASPKASRRNEASRRAILIAAFLLAVEVLWGPLTSRWLQQSGPLSHQLMVEHVPDVMALADHVRDLGPRAC